MKITFEKLGNLALIYISFQEGDRVIEVMLTDVSAYLLLDGDHRWLGVEVSNTQGGNMLVLPQLKPCYMGAGGENVLESEDKITVLFDKLIPVVYKQEVECNMDVAAGNQLLGIELIADCFAGKMALADRFTTYLHDELNEMDEGEI